MILSMLMVQLFRRSGEIMRALPSNHQIMTCAILWEHMSRIYEKTNVLVSDLVLHKLGCTATEDG